MGSRTKPGAALVAVTLVAGACMENDMVAPEEITDPADLVVYYPGRGANWDAKNPAEAGLDAASVAAALDYAAANETGVPRDLRAHLDSIGAGAEHQSLAGPVKERGGVNGMIVHRGYIVAEWGDTARTDMAFGIGASLLATTVGLAADRGLIVDLDASVGRRIDDGAYDSSHNAPITWRQSLQQTSEWTGAVWGRPDSAGKIDAARQLQAPGTYWEPNAVRADRLALSATMIWGESLADVLDREVLTPIGASRSWRWQPYRSSSVAMGDRDVEVVAATGRWGGGLWISTRDLARVGLLYARDGLWREQQVLSSEWIVAARTPAEANSAYGLGWELNTEAASWPDAPATAYAAAGLGENLLWIDPDNEIVLVARWIDADARNGLIERVADIVR